MKNISNKAMIRISCGFIAAMYIVSFGVLAARDEQHRSTFIDSEHHKKIVIEKYDDGGIESIQEYNDSMPEGIYQSWWRNGNRKSKGFFVNGKENGPIYIWWKNGNKEAIGKFVNGKVDGEGLSWFQSGRRHTKVFYTDGVETGIWTSWYENKKQSSLLTFASGKIIKCKAWDTHSKLVYEGKDNKKCTHIYTSHYLVSLESEDPS